MKQNVVNTQAEALVPAPSSIIIVGVPGLGRRGSCSSGCSSGDTARRREGREGGEAEALQVDGVVQAFAG